MAVKSDRSLVHEGGEGAVSYPEARTGQGSVCWLNRQGLGLWLSEGVAGFLEPQTPQGASYLLSPIYGVWSDLCSLTCSHWENLVQPVLAFGQWPLEHTARWLDLARPEGQKEMPALSLREHCWGSGWVGVLGCYKDRSTRGGLPCHWPPEAHLSAPGGGSCGAWPRAAGEHGHSAWSSRA